MKGIDVLDDEDGDVQISKNKNIQGIANKIKNFIVDLTDELTPLKEKTKLIELQMDKSVSSLFVTFRFLIALSMINLFGFGFLIY